jgi:large subunit ribosomal protein L21
MFAVIEIGGFQYKVSPNDVIEVNRIEAEPGSSINIPDVVLYSSDGSDAVIGQPYVDGALVEAKVIEHKRGDKVRVLKFKAKKRFAKEYGHRQELTKLEIVNIKA